jgi:hypothetical protein
MQKYTFSEIQNDFDNLFQNNPFESCNIFSAFFCEFCGRFIFPQTTQISADYRTIFFARL